MKRVVFLLAIILLSSLVSASFVLHNSSIERTYNPKENIRGWINISFQNELVTSKLKGNYAGEMKLIDFLEANNADFTCNPTNCDPGWISSNDAISKSFSLSSGREKIIGLVLNGNFKEITRLSFNISVNNSEGCMNPLDIDFLDNGVDWKSTKTGTSYSCSIGSGRGCFDSAASLQDVDIGLTPYCEKIKLNSGSNFQLGAWVRKSGSWSTGMLKMYLFSQDGEQLKSCDLPEPSISGEEISCNISYFNSEIQDYYVCVKANPPSQHKTRKESSGEKCGFYAYPGEQTEYNDYWIFAKSSRFTEIGKVVFNQQEYGKLNEASLVDDAESYILEQYENNCSPCILPIKFKANADLNIRIDNLDLGYSSYSGERSENKLYDASAVPSKINSGQLILDVGLSDITAPVNYGSYDFYLYLENNQILSKQISVVNNAKINNIYPLVQYALVNGKIYADISSPRNITSYKWDFGDEKSEETAVNYVYHKYEALGSYDLTLEVTDSSGYKTLKEVTIEVASPTTKVNSTIQDYKKRLDNITSQLTNIGWYKDEISQKLDLENSINQINGIEREYNSAASEEDYISIMEKLNELKIPITIKKASGKIPVLISQEDIDSSAVADVLDDCGEACKKAIAAWDQNHLQLDLDFAKIQAYYDNGVETIINAYKLKIQPDEDQDKGLYLFLPDSTIKDLESRDVASYKVVSFDSISTQAVEFTSATDLKDLNIFLSPEFSLINIDEQVICNQNGVCEGDETWRNCRQDCKPWGWALLLIIIVLVIAFIVYLLLQWWYKEKYESSLFKNRNDLYNLLNFISNGKSQGLSERDIAGKLKSQGWKSEQINYAFKKFEGKAIMPLDFIKLFKKQEIGKIKS
ncbi:MAG: PKD domain-containing protein [Candidatus Pacearchaeota archaeon]|nr:PKD domain-containing protein [Candidatus Pacearchaeota archaeon]